MVIFTTWSLCEHYSKSSMEITKTSFSPKANSNKSAYELQLFRQDLTGKIT